MTSVNMKNTDYYKSGKHIENLNKIRLKSNEKCKEIADQNKLNYELNPNQCIECNNSLSYKKRNNRFCKKSCAATYNNRKRVERGWKHSEDSKNAISQFAQQNPKGVAIDPSKRGDRKGARTSKYEFRHCPTCGIEFETRVSDNKIHCSTKCIRLGGYREGSSNVKTGYYNGVYCGSTYELAFLIWHINHNISIKRYNGYFEYEFEGKKRKYFPDFICNNQIIEIKGRQGTIDVEKIKSANAILIDNEKCHFYLNYVSKLYNLPKDKLYEIYDGYKPKFSYNCSFCKKDFDRNKEIKTNERFCGRSCSGKYRKSKQIHRIGKKINTKRKFTKEQALEIFDSDLPSSTLSLSYNISIKGIWDIKNKRSYKWIHN